MDALNHAPEIITKVFEILDLILWRSTLLALAALGAYGLIKRHP